MKNTHTLDTICLAIRLRRSYYPVRQKTQDNANHSNLQKDTFTPGDENTSCSEAHFFAEEDHQDKLAVTMTG